MTKKTTKGKKPSQKMTVSQFKMWIQGLSEFQEDDWIPNVNQWNLIRERIDLLEEGAVQQVYVQQGQPASNGHVVLPNQNTASAQVGGTAASMAPAPRFSGQPLGQQQPGQSTMVDERGVTVVIDEPFKQSGYL